MLSRDSPHTQVLTWAPQNDVLGHPRVRAFLSHCGANSMYEVWHPLTQCSSCAQLTLLIIDKKIAWL